MRCGHVVNLATPFRLQAAAASIPQNSHKAFARFQGKYVDKNESADPKGRPIFWVILPE
jgi:hypothetical protein